MTDPPHRLDPALPDLGSGAGPASGTGAPATSAAAALAPERAGRDEVEDDAALVAASVHTPELFAVLFDRYAPAIHRYAARRLGSDAADDVTAETFLTAFRIRSRYDTARPVARPWLYGIAARQIGRHRRAEVRAWKILARTGTDPVAESWTESADDRLAAQAAARPLAGALAGLSAGDRHVLLLVAWADLSYQEVAEALDIPVGTVRSRLNRARRKVRCALGESAPMPEPYVQESGRP